MINNCWREYEKSIKLKVGKISNGMRDKITAKLCILLFYMFLSSKIIGSPFFFFFFFSRAKNGKNMNIQRICPKVDILWNETDFHNVCKEINKHHLSYKICGSNILVFWMQLSKFTRLVGTKETQNATRVFSSFWYKAHTQSILVSYVCLSNYSKLKVQRFFF